MSALLTASDVTFAYGDRPALRGVSLTLAAGEVVALLGPNGSGKSTLIKSLLGHTTASGTIEWDGKPLSGWTRRALAKRVAYLPQSPTMEPGQTVADVLRLGRSPYWSAFGIESSRDAQVVQEIAQRLHLTEFLKRPVDELSGGQRQRVFFGRCLVQEPAALLLDEPVTFLDLRHQVELCRLLREVSGHQQLAVLMAGHDLNLALAFADRIVLLSEGRVIADGPPNILTAEVLSSVYGLPMISYDQTAGRRVFLPRL